MQSRTGINPQHVSNDAVAPSSLGSEKAIQRVLPDQLKRFFGIVLQAAALGINLTQDRVQCFYYAFDGLTIPIGHEAHHFYCMQQVED
jgi:hypothetical protein